MLTVYARYPNKIYICQNFRWDVTSREASGSKQDLHPKHYIS